MGAGPDPPLHCHPPSYWLRLFSSQTFSHINTPTFSNPVILHTYPPTKLEGTERSETSAYKIQTPGNYPEESVQHSEHGKSLKSRIMQYATKCLQMCPLLAYLLGRAWASPSWNSRRWPWFSRPLQRGQQQRTPKIQ